MECTHFFHFDKTLFRNTFSVIYLLWKWLKAQKLSNQPLVTKVQEMNFITEFSSFFLFRFNYHCSCRRCDSSSFALTRVEKLPLRKCEMRG